MVPAGRCFRVVNAGIIPETGIVHTCAALFVLRLLLGMGEAASYPSYNKSSR
jgi:hypothetical protein